MQILLLRLLLTAATRFPYLSRLDDMKMMDSKFTMEIQQTKDALKEKKASHQAHVKENFYAVGGE